MAKFTIKAALAQFPVYVSLLDRYRKVVWANRTDFGISPGDLVGTSGEQYLHPDDRAAYEDAFARCLYSREVVRYAIRVETPESGTVAMHGTVAPVVVSGAVRYVWAFVHDARSPAYDPPEPLPAAPAGALWLSPRSEAILAAITPGEVWTTAATIAEAIGEDVNTVRILARNLVDRRFLRSSRARGYRHLKTGDE